MDEATPKRPSASSLHLIEQDIHVRRLPAAAGARVVAEVQCARRGCTMDVEQCARCPHFVRIETHEAGYLMLCSADEDESPQAARETERGEHGP